jgi:hypothetical protein
MAPQMVSAPQATATVTIPYPEPEKTSEQIREEQRIRAAREAERIAAEKEEERIRAAREAERIAAEKEEERIRAAREAKRIAAEKRKLEDAHYSFLCDRFADFQKKRFEAPPSLLALEAADALDEFREFAQSQTPRTIEPAAAERFESEIKERARDGEQLIQSMTKSLRSGSTFRRLLETFSLGYSDSGKLLELSKKCVVSLSMPDLGSPAREAVSSARKFLRGAWSKRLVQDKQSLFSVHRCAGKTVFHLGSGSLGSIFITLPSSLDPEALAEAFVSRLRHAAGNFFSSDSTIGIVDGAYQNINYNHIFPGNIVLRTVQDDCDTFARNLDAILERDGPSSENSSLHVGVPASESELEAVFRTGGGDWDLWNGVAELWKRRANSKGFDRPESASAQDVLVSLATSKNVVIVVAHAEEQTLFMPAPPPEGSSISADQILERKDEIMANKPLVYLFCCETAEISNLKSFAQVLLECGASGVVAPQTKIDAERSINFFDNLLERERVSSNALTKLHLAKQRSGYREMEIFVG